MRLVASLVETAVISTGWLVFISIFNEENNNKNMQAFNYRHTETISVIISVSQ